jgi:rhodanese-related sulfurtransferase
METVALVVAVLALILALAALARSGASGRNAEDVRADVRRQLSNQSDELATTLGALRELLARQAAGETLDPDQIREGRLWRDVREDSARAKVEAGEFRVLDVRSHQETAGGAIEGAVLIPIDELEARHHELKNDPRPMLVVCAMGGRSAAACEFLSNAGHFALFNLEGGMSAWRGPTKRPQISS